MSRSFLFKIFQGSSSESDNEEAGEGLSQDPGDKKSGPGGKGMGNDSDEEVSDTESMESDEVAKLQSEAGDMDMETEEVCEDLCLVCRVRIL